MKPTIPVAIVVLACCTLVGAQNKGKTGAQPKQTTPAKGTVQMPGDKGVIGTTYQLGAKGNELHFTLDSAEFAQRFPAVEDMIFADSEDRLLVLKYTVQNPQKFPVRFDYTSFHFTSVSPADENRENPNYIYHATTFKRYDPELKPAQKVQAVAVFPIHGTGPVTKLIVQRDTGVPVLRFDLRDKVKKMTSIWSPDGVDTVIKSTGEFGKVWDSGPFDVTIDKIEKVETQVGNYEVPEGQALFLVHTTVKNSLKQPYRAVWGMYEPKLVDENGEEIEWRADWLTITGNKTIDQDLDPGDTIRGKLIFVGSKDLKPTKLTLSDSITKRTISFPVP